MKILIVEDELIPATYLKEILLKAKYDVVDIVRTGKKAIELAKTKKPDLILMDIMLKDSISGIDATIQIQRHDKHIMIVFLTAYSESNIIEAAIDANASGYFLKPYNQEEILANLKILHNKNKIKNKKQNNNITLISDYSYCLEHKQLYLHQKEIYLSQQELKAIDYFCHHIHVVLNFETIIDYIWEEKKPQQTLRSLIHRIREKTCQELIINVNKLGYKLASHPMN